MKKTCIYLFLLLSTSSMSQNLVPNPSFEDTLFCPHFTDQMNACLNWSSFGNSPDYFNACDGAGLNVPNAFPGFQYAHLGVAMAGIATYINPTGPNGPNYREIIGAQLSSPLQIGQKYFLSFFINHSGYGYPYQEIAANKIGLRFSKISFDSCCPPPINNSAHLYTDSILKDTIGWYKISGSFIADSAYSFLSIGNFFDDANTDTLIFGGMPFGSAGAYYYIDDACVSTDSLYCENWTSISEATPSKDNIIFFPNPASNYLFVKTQANIERIEIINYLNQLVFCKLNINDKMTKIGITDFKNGLFYIRIKTKKGLTTNIINIIH